MSSKNTIRSKYDELLAKFQTDVESSPLRQDSSEFQNLLTTMIESFLDFKTKIHSKLALFSDNETLEDLSTSAIKFLSFDYYLALMIAKKQAVTVSDPLTKNKLRIKFLEKSIQVMMQFMVSLQDYRILDEHLCKKIDKFEKTFHPTLEELYSQPSSSEDLSGAQLKRKQKIEMYQKKKELDENISLIESRYDEEAGDDDEKLRELYLLQLKQLSYKGINVVEQILYEVELLNNFTSKAPPKVEQTNEITQEGRKTDPTGYTEKLETLNTPLLSKTGKVLRNFTLVDKKSELQNKVFGYGQYGPTVSVEEFLEQEFENGRVLQGGEEPEDVPDEDNDEWNDKETYKAREWDEFKEANPRGSGNTMNRG